MTDLLLAEAMLRMLRAMTCITGTLVFVDSIGILMAAYERPAHRPKWSALSWASLSATAAGVTAYFLFDRAGFIGDTNNSYHKFATLMLYTGLTIGFTCRAVSRANKPLLTVTAVLGLSVAGSFFAFQDLIG